MSLAGGVGFDYPRWEQEAHRVGHKCPADGFDKHISSAPKEVSASSGSAVAAVLHLTRF